MQLWLEQNPLTTPPETGVTVLSPNGSELNTFRESEPRSDRTDPPGLVALVKAITTKRESGAAVAVSPLVLSDTKLSVNVTDAVSPTTAVADEALNVNVSSNALATGLETVVNIPKVKAEITASEIRLKINFDISFLSKVVLETFPSTAV